ncbi:MAG: hypothetical protein ABIE92_06925 [bacterium]
MAGGWWLAGFIPPECSKKTPARKIILDKAFYILYIGRDQNII